MRYVVDSLQALATTIRNVFRKPTTVEFPKEKRERPERARVSFALVHDEHGEEACIGCFLCEKIYPSDVITVKAAGKRVSEATGKKRGYCEDFTLDLNACIFCELCVQVCPADAILMTKTHEAPAFTREDLVLTMDKLYANEKDAVVAWATGSKLLEMQNPKRGEPPPEKKAPPAKKPAPAKAREARERGGRDVIEAIGFGVIGSILLFSGVRVVTSENLVRSVLWLALTLSTTAVLFLMLSAPFIASIQILLYTGGVITLMLFGVMLTNRETGVIVANERTSPVKGLIIAASMFGIITAAVLGSRDALPVRAEGATPVTAAALGQSFLTEHLLAFEVLSVLLLAAMIGAIVLARRRDFAEERPPQMKRVVRAPEPEPEPTSKEEEE